MNISTAYRQENMLAISALRIWKKEDEKFRNILDYLASLRPAWAIDLFLTIQPEQNKTVSSRELVEQQKLGLNQGMMIQEPQLWSPDSFILSMARNRGARTAGHSSECP